VSEIELRASDAEREHALAVLSEHCAAGRLTLDELSERVDAVHATRMQSELDELLRDLPAAVAPVRRRPARFTLAVFSGAARRGCLRLGRWTWAGALFGNVDLDLRQARLDRPRTTVVVTVMFGNVDVYVPDGVETDVAGLPLFAAVDCEGRDNARPGAPVVRVRVFALFGAVDVWRIPHGATGRFRDLITLVRKQQRELTL